MQLTGQLSAPQVRRSLAWEQYLPPCWDWVLTPRVRVWKPRPQLLEQADHAFQSSTTQSTGQPCELQFWSSLRPGQALPPLRAPTVTERKRFCEPVPQDLVQGPQAPQVETWQSVGQA